jgi:hypothetical protein
MTDNSVTLSAIQLADRAIRRAMANQRSCEAEIKAALGAIRYIGEAFRRESEFKSIQFSLIDPTHRIESLGNPDLTQTAFCQEAEIVLTAIEALRGIYADLQSAP